MLSVFLSLLIPTVLGSGAEDDLLDLPEAHRPYQRGQEGRCWGHEPGCRWSGPESFSSEIRCLHEIDPRSHRPALDTFYHQADFGYLRNKLGSMVNLCQPLTERGASLDCSWNMEFCQGRNLFIDFSEIQGRDYSLKYSMEVLSQGRIGGGGCRLDKKAVADNMEYLAPLQSWSPELRYFQSFEDDFSDSSDQLCDHVVTRPTVLLKLDATVNLYHHFCDFFNLYASLHLNSTTDKNSFSPDMNLLVWENSPYQSTFGDVLRAFTDNPILNLNSFGSKRVCFKNLLFPLNPRMIFGLFYNTPIIPDCSHSGLFRAFSEFLIHRLKIETRTETRSSRIRVTLLSRQTRTRRLLNEEDLVEALESTGRYEVTLAAFTHRTPFLEQIQIVRDTDILIGMHGAGLTHVLFLPDWATLFESYHCEDPTCYGDLARLRGVNYVTWEDDSLKEASDSPQTSSQHQKHPKFKNYSLDKTEFVRIVDKAAESVRSHEKFKKLDIDSREKVEL